MRHAPPRSWDSHADCRLEEILLFEPLELQGDYHGALTRYRERSAPSAQPEVNPSLNAAALSRCHLRLGEFSLALEEAYSALTHAQRENDNTMQGYALGRVAAVYAGLRDLPMALEYAKSSLSILKDSQVLALRAEAQVNLAAVLLLDDRSSEARTHALAAWKATSGMRATAPTIRAAFYISTADLNEGNLNEALVWAERALAIADTLCDPFYIAKSLFSVGHCHGLLRQFDRATSAFERAESLFESLGDVTSANGTRERLAEIFEASGDFPSALSNLKQVLAFERTLHIEQRRTARKEQPETVQGFRSRLLSRYPDLSLAETKICERLKDGRSTKVIAHELCISGKTVERHRANIRAKLELKGKESLALILSQI